ncbi:peroxide stress protein YaaA [Alphaproteobacteria bacterium]|nr:peroxide stress protein YaaA [Alphaproteobacteria bacterium]
MIVVVSPAKKLDFASDDVKQNWSVPDYLDQSAELIKTARKLTRSQIGKLMNVSDKLADLNYQRYRDFEEPFTTSNARQAALAFKGDTYVGLDAETLSEEDLEFAQNHFRILSGLYGILRPLDLMQAYRLEMGCRLQSSKGKNLYDFWGSRLTDGLNKLMGEQNTDVIINCASNEYFKSINVNDLKGSVITPVFKIVRGGFAKSPGMVIKRARGMMARYIIQKKINNVEGLKEFKMDGYKFMPTLSNDKNYEFHKITD